MTDRHPENVSPPENQPDDLRPVSPVTPSRGGAGPPLPERAGCSTVAARSSAPVAEGALPVLWLLTLHRRPVSHVLGVGTNTVGRHPDNDVVIASQFVSGLHCAILVYPNGRCAVQDLGSTNGVYVNGERLTGPRRLHYGDELGVGGRRFVLLPSVNGTASTEPAG